MKMNFNNGLPLFITGIAISMVALSINQHLQFQVQLASLLSPTGAQVSIMGMRIKHWLVGLFLLFISVMLVIQKETQKIGLISFGSATFLILDEYQDMLRTLTTGEYP